MYSQKAFTLVELIVVITILAILGTVGFLSLQGYSSSARDSARLSDLANLSKAMDVQLAAGKLLPQPNAPMLTLTASGTTIGYQGCAGSGVLGSLGLSPSMDDPLNGTCYTYETNAAQNKYQVLSLQESASQATALSPFVDEAYAGAYDTRVPSTRGNQLGILLGTWANLNQPVQEYASFTGLDLTKTTSGSGYVMVFANKDTTASVPTSGSGAYTGALFTFAYNHRSDLSRNVALAAADSSLIGYWDMETTTGTLLKDLSGYGNNGTCYNSGTVVSCGGTSGWPQFSNGNGTTGRAMNFDGVDDSICVNTLTDDVSLKNGNTVVIKASIFKTKAWDQVLLGKHHPIFISAFSWALRTWEYINYPWKFLDSSEQLPINKMQILSSVWSLGDNRLTQYVNWAPKSMDGVNSGSITSSSAWALCIGNDSLSYSRYFEGTIDEVRIYNRALTDSEIQALYMATK